MAHGWHEQGTSTTDSPWGGSLRHSGQPDMEGGTDLYDARDAWDYWSGADLKIKSGQGWSAVREAREDWRAIILQGTGNTPGQGTYTGAHAIVVLPEPHSGGEWLIGDPLCTDYQRVPESKLREWAEAFSSGIAFAVSRSVPPSEPEPPEPPEPTPEPPPAPIPPPPPVNAGGAGWHGPEPSSFATWPGTWPTVTGSVWGMRDGSWPLPWPPIPIELARWSRARWPSAWLA